MRRYGHLHLQHHHPKGRGLDVRPTGAMRPGLSLGKAMGSDGEIRWQRGHGG